MADSQEHHAQRSEFIRRLVQWPGNAVQIPDRYTEAPPRKIIQYWHDLQDLPADVADCVASWTRWTEIGFTHLLFDEFRARAFIRCHLDARHLRAFDSCYHPAMQADYFRLCYLFIEGGFYVDADDACVATDISYLFEDGRLKLQPLCYDAASASMVDTAKFLHDETHASTWIFYFNNNPLIASRGHPIIERALQAATDALEFRGDALPEIQTTTGPGNLSRAIFELGIASGSIERDLTVLRNWDSVAVSIWPLSHRADSRNWRLSNQQRFRRQNE